MNDYEKLIVEKEGLLREFLEENISGRALKKLKSNGKIRVNGIERTVRFKVNPGDEVELEYNETPSDIYAWNFPLHVVYEDDYVMVVLKPKGIPSICTRRHPYHSLANIIQAYYKANHITSAIHLVSRLDKDTSGLLLVAKSGRIHDIMASNFERHYLFLVEGKMEGKGTINLPIDRKEDSIKRYVMEGGKEAITHYEVLKSNEDMSLVKAQLETGRTHQIRVHFSHLGHPLVGDILYGKAHPDYHGQALHSCYLKFIHPITNKEMVFEDLPDFVFDIE